MTNLIRGLTDLPSTDPVTDAGLAAAAQHFQQIAPDVSEFERDLAITMAGRDWSHGNEQLAMKHLSRYLDLAGVYRVISAMVAGSKPQTADGGHG